jgi:hypothetical protein
MSNENTKYWVHVYMNWTHINHGPFYDRDRAEEAAVAILKGNPAVEVTIREGEKR